MWNEELGCVGCSPGSAPALQYGFLVTYFYCIFLVPLMHPFASTLRQLD